MFLRIDTLELNNIRCFQKEKFTFSEGLNVITGPNGAGKSTIITSIGFGLFGNSYLTGLNLTNSDLIMRGEEKGRILIRFTTPEGTFVSRHNVRNSGSDNWKIFREGSDTVLADGVTPSREVIEKLLGEGIDAHTFKTALCSRQGELTKLLDDTASERNDQIRRILGLEEFDRTGQVIKKYEKELQQKLSLLNKEAEVLNANKLDRVKIETEISTVEDSIQQKEKDLIQLTNQQNTLKIRVKKLRRTAESISHLQKQIKKDQQVIAENTLKIRKHHEEQLEFSKQLGVKEITSETTNKMLQVANEKAKQLALEIQTLSQQMEKFKATIRKIGDIKSSTQKTENEINAKEGVLSNFLEMAAVEDREKKIQDYSTAITTYNQKLTRQKELIDKVKNELKKLEKEIKEHNQFIESNREEFEAKFGEDITSVEHLLIKNLEKRQTLEDGIDHVQENLNREKENLGKVNSNIETIRTTIDLLDGHTDHDCPVCKRSFSDVDTRALALEHTKELEKKTAELERIKKIVTRNEENIRKYRKKLPVINDNIGQLQRYSEILKNLDDRSKKVENLYKQKKETDKSLITLKDEYDKIRSTPVVQLTEERQREISELNRINQLKEELSLFSQKRELQENQMKELQSEIIDFDIDEIKNQHTIKKKQAEEVRTQVSLITEQVQPSLAELQRLQVSIEAMKQQLDRNRIELDQLQHDFDPLQLEKMEKELEDLNTSVGTTGQQITSLEEKRELLSNDLSVANQQEKNLGRIHENIAEVKQLLPIALKFRRILNEAPELLIAKTTANISTYLTNMVKRLLPGQGFDKIAFQNDGDVHLYNKDERIDKNTLSGGERTVLALALRLSLADFVAPLQFLTLDEPTNHLDAQRVEEFLEIIDREQLFSSSKGQLLLVTHRPEFDRNAEGSIKLVIENGVRTQDE